MVPLHRGAVADFVAERFGGVTIALEVTRTIGLTPVIALDNDPERVAVIAVNNGAFPITLRRSSEVVAGAGIVLLGGGGALILTVEEDADLVGLEWYGISTAASQSLFTLAVRRDTTIEIVPGG